jgi:hypothetical protein
VKGVVTSAILILGLMAGFAVSRTAMAANPAYDGSPATDTATVTITVPTFVDIPNLGDFSLDIPPIIPGAASGYGEFNVATNYAAGVTVTAGCSEFSPASADITSPTTITDDDSSVPIITVVLAFGLTGVAAADSTAQLTVNLAVPESTQVAVAGDNNVRVTLSNIAAAVGSLPATQIDRPIYSRRILNTATGHTSKLATELDADHPSGIAM